MRRTGSSRYKIPKNMGVAPRYDVWNAKYEPWEHMKRMGRLVGTGFYIPPEWYNHFRIFPPMTHNFQQERTLNPHNEAEPTQDSTDHVGAERRALRDELARRSRLLASEGMRYYNIFWVRKPLDRMERAYYELTRRGCAHDVAIRKVLQTFYEELTVKRRMSAIQAEEAKLSGRFITMREAVVVMRVLAQLQREQPTAHQISMLAKAQHALAHDAPGIVAEVLAGPRAHTRSHDDDEDVAQSSLCDTHREVEKDDAHMTTRANAATASEACESSVAAADRHTDGADGSGTSKEVSGAGADASVGADALADMLADASEAGTHMTTGGYTVRIVEVEQDSVRQLAERAMDYSGSASWYSGSSPVIEK